MFKWKLCLLFNPSLKNQTSYHVYELRFFNPLIVFVFGFVVGFLVLALVAQSLPLITAAIVTAPVVVGAVEAPASWQPSAYIARCLVFGVGVAVVLDGSIQESV